MSYADPVQRIAYFRGIRLGTELQSIIPAANRLGGETAADLDRDTAFVSIMSPNMEFRYNVLVYLLGSGSYATPQIALHRAFLQELRKACSAALRFNDLVWIDDISLHTTVNGGGTVTGESLNQSIAVTDKSALGTLTPNETLLWIGSETENQGFFGIYEGGDATHITIDVPGDVYLGDGGGVLEEQARVVKSGYDVYVVTFGYHRCKYSGQTMPEVQENSQDSERFSMTYEFISDLPGTFPGAT